MNKTTLSVIGFALLAVSAAIFFALPNNSKNALSASQPVNSQSTAVIIGNKSFSAEVASSPEQKTTGLSFRDSLGLDDSMLFVFDPAEVVSFWMYEMRFPLDIIWIKDGQITGIERNVPIPAEGTPAESLARYPSGGAVDYVLEVNAGQSEGLKIGDSVEIISTNTV